VPILGNQIAAFYGGVNLIAGKPLSFAFVHSARQAAEIN
jgi:hypothetical protein